MTTERFDKLLDFVRRLNEAKIAYRIETYREDAISVSLAVPGERWEVDFLADGAIDVERFRSDGTIDDESLFEQLFALYSADSPEPSPTMNPSKGAVLNK
jgi:hypothetical protein